MRLDRMANTLATQTVSTVGGVLFHRHSPAAVQRAVLEAMLRPLPLPAHSQVSRVTLGGRRAERVTVAGSDERRVLLYLHGGGYTIGSARAFRSLAAHLSRSAQAVVYTLDYRLAPEHPYPAALDDAVAAVLELCNDLGHPPSRVAICGDSAGGGLAVATARCLTDYHGLRVGALGLISPWTDPASAALYRAEDTAVNRTWSAVSATKYRGQADPRTPGLAPMHGDLSGLPAMTVHYGRGEVLAKQIKRFVDAVREAGTAADLHAYPVWHSGHAWAAVVPAAAKAVNDLGGAVRHHLDAPVTSHGAGA